MEIGKRLKNLRIDLDITQEQLAQEIGVSGNYVSEIEKGKKSPSDTIYIALEFKFGVSGTWLKKGTGEKYVSERVLPTKKESEFIQAFREMSSEDRSMILVLVEKLKKT